MTGSREPRATILVEATLVALVVTALVTAASTTLPDRYVATAVGAVFLAATWALVWRKDDEAVVRAGLSLGGLVLPGAFDRAQVARAARALGEAVLLALVASVVLFVPFFFGFRAWFGVPGVPVFGVTGFSAPPMGGLAETAFGQVVLVALPEEAFYRGYLQSRLDEAWPPTVRVLGARLGPALVVTSVVFALGHLATVHHAARLAVFFPSLVFGFLRARTGGIGAACLFHAACNVFSEFLGRGYGVY